MAGELTTANYGWTKPTVGASTDAWGGYINADLDGIDNTVHGIQTSVPAASTTTPAMNGTAAVGVGATFARADHVHPTDTSLAPLISPALTGTPTAPTAAPGTNTTQIATTAFVAALPAAMNDNRIVNGDMRIDQRNNGTAGLTIGYTIDRWQYNASQASKIGWQRGAGGLPGFPYSLYAASQSAYAALAADSFYFRQIIEADMVSDFAWGTAGAQPVTLSFWVNSSLTGTFSGAIQNMPTPPTRCYPFTFSIPVANTWTRIVITIPADTAGTWVMSGNAAGVGVAFDLGSGSTYRAAANAWASGQYNGATGAVSVVATNGATFYVTGVKLEIGSVATPYNRQSPAKSLADCQRYFYKPTDVVMSSAYAAAAAQLTIYGLRRFPVTMRAAPTQTGATFAVTNCGAPTLSNLVTDGGSWSSTNTAAGVYQFVGNAGTETYSAEL